MPIHITNDRSCGWLTALPMRQPTPELTHDIQTDWLIVGAGYTGLSAARKLGQLKPNAGIVLLDANHAGESASARNSGYLVDSTLNDGHLSDAGLQNFLKKYELNKAGINAVKNFISDYQVDCDWNPCGKFHATALEQNEAKLENFSKTLNSCDIANELVSKQRLTKQLGTGFYRTAVYTNGGVLLQPAKLVRGMIEHLPVNVKLYENTRVTHWRKTTNGFDITTTKGSVKTKNLLICCNGFMSLLGFKTNRAFPLTLTASMTRPLTDAEHQSIGSPSEWGVLSAQAMGATVRLTQDRRIMIRNTAEAYDPISMSEAELNKRKATHVTGLIKRFPFLSSDSIETTWSGVTCISGNSANIFDRLDTNLFIAGCYNGGGIGLATLFGEQLAIKAARESSSLITQIEARPKPNWLPPQPFLRWGVKTRLMKDRNRATPER